MRPAGATNFKWSMADVDFVVGLARAGRTSVEICERLKFRSTNIVSTFRSKRQVTAGFFQATPDEIKDICWQSGIAVKAA